MRGFDVARRARAIRPETAVIALTGYDSPVYAHGLAESGVRALLSKTSTGAQIVDSIRAVAAGRNLLPAESHSLGDGAPLSLREAEVLKLMAGGKRNQEIADELVISSKTVEFHLRRIFSKLGARSRTQAATRAQQLGLLD